MTTTGGTRRSRFIELAQEEKTRRMEDEEARKREQRAVLERRVRARARIENLKRVLREHPELKIAGYLISMGVALFVIQWLLDNGTQEW